jgi:hypothetical protein
MEDGSDHQVPIRVALPAHLRTLAGIPRGTTEVRVVVGAGDPDSEVRDGGQTESETISIAALLNAVEAAYPMLRGTIRGHHGGERRAHLRYFGEGQDLSLSLDVGSTIQILNIGGVMGICDSANPDVGPPFDCEVLGTVLHFPYLGERIGVPARVGARTLDPNAILDTRGVPVVALAGTCMDSGKTAAACAIVSRLRHLGFHVAACKATGVSLRRDILAMEDAGAQETMIFSDLGIVATTATNGPALTRSLLSGLAEYRPDVIVIELGDGLLGAYGVEAILEDERIRAAFTAVILCANDPVAAWGGAKILREQFGIEPAVVTGPATDNAVGIDQIKQRMSLPAINAMTNGTALGDLIAAQLQAVSQEKSS